MIPDDPRLEQKIRALREERSGLHPDKTGGEFSSSVAQKRYFEIEAELEQLRSQGVSTSQQLIPVSQLPALIEALGGAVARKQQLSAQELEREFRRTATLELSRKYLTPKISSSVAAAIVAFLFTQTPTLAEHPLLSRFFSTPNGLQVLGFAFVTSIAVFVLSWLRERKEASVITRLTSRNVLTEVVRTLDEMPAGQLIEEAELRHLLFRHTFRWGRSVIFPGPDEETLDSIFEVHLQRLVEREILKDSSARRGIERVFEKL